MRPPLFSKEDGKVFIDTPWPRNTVFSTELLEMTEWVRVEVDEGVPVRVLIAVENGTADYRVDRFDDATGTVEVTLKKCRRTPHRPAKAKRLKKRPSLGRHSSTGCYGILREGSLGAIYCESCGWTSDV